MKLYIYLQVIDKLQEDIKYFEEKCGVPPRIFCVPLGARVTHFGDYCPRASLFYAMDKVKGKSQFDFYSKLLI